MEFSPASPPRIFWNSRKRSAAKHSLDNALDGNLDNSKDKGLKTNSDNSKKEEITTTAASNQLKDSNVQEAAEDEQKEDPKAALSERRKALFEPLDPIPDGVTRTSAEVLLPPPDFDTALYPKGWLLGKRRKLVNVDVVESMRIIAVQEMNRKDREINGLNEQLEEDARCLEHLQLQLLQERSKRAEAERENSALQDQISMLMDMLDGAQDVGDEEAALPDSQNLA